MNDRPLPRTRRKYCDSQHCDIVTKYALQYDNVANGSRENTINSYKLQPYESPLNCFKESLNEFTSYVTNLLDKDTKMNRGMVKREKERNIANRLKRNSLPSQNSVIVINDSDNESFVNQDDTSLSIIECSPVMDTVRSLSLSKRPQTMIVNNKTNPYKQKRKRSSVILLDSDTSVSSSTSVMNKEDSQSMFNQNTVDIIGGENIAPMRVEDDVVELWSHLQNPIRRTRSASKQPNQENDIINTRPNLIDPKCIMAETEPAWKKRRLFTEHVKNKKKKKQNAKFHVTKKQIKANERRNANSNPVLHPNVRLREVIIDGSNVAMLHTNGHTFSEKGIQLVINYFQLRGHVVKVFLPQHVRKKNYTFLEKLYKDGIAVFTPSRCIDGRQITPYDDRYILQYATKCGGVVISSDQYRDLYKEKPEWRDTIINRLLTPTFVGDYVMFPEDPLGKSGPNLETFLRH